MDTLLTHYYPTKIIVVNDDEDASENIKSYINNDVASVEFFTDSHQALKLINESLPPNFIANQHSLEEDKLIKLPRMIHNIERYNEISTIIIPLRMSEINGIEFCKSITNPFVRKILLIDKDDENLAIEAIKNKFIDEYIRKSPISSPNEIVDIIKRNQYEYFKVLTTIIVNKVFKNNLFYNLKNTIFDDPILGRYINNLFKQHKICEYYICGGLNDFVCLTINGERKFLYVFTPSAFNMNQILSDDILSFFSEKEKSENIIILNEVAEDKKTICFPFAGKYPKITTKNFKKYILPTQRVQGNMLYQISFASYPHIKKSNTIYSFDQFINRRAP